MKSKNTNNDINNINSGIKYDTLWEKVLACVSSFHIWLKKGIMSRRLETGLSLDGFKSFSMWIIIKLIGVNLPWSCICIIASLFLIAKHSWDVSAMLILINIDKSNKDSGWFQPQSTWESLQEENYHQLASPFVEIRLHRSPTDTEPFCDPQHPHLCGGFTTFSVTPKQLRSTGSGS